MDESQGVGVADVFISYSSRDRDLAKSLANDVARFGLSVWWDHELVGGASFRREIQKELQEAHAVIVLWTPNSVHSDWVLEEAEEALHQKKLVPVRHGSLEVRQLPLGGFRSLQTLLLGESDRLQRALFLLTGNSTAQLSFRYGTGRGIEKFNRDEPNHWGVRENRAGLTAILVDGRGLGRYGEEISRSCVKDFWFSMEDEMFINLEALDGYSQDASDYHEKFELVVRPQALEWAFRRCASSLKKLTHERPEFAGYCCPGLGVTLFGHSLVWVSAGDCILMLYRAGQITRINADHSVGAVLDLQAASGHISWAQAQSAPNRQAQRSGLTGGEIPIVDKGEKQLQLRVDDWLVLSTYGLTSLSTNDIATCMAAHAKDSPDRMVSALLDAVVATTKVPPSTIAIVAIRVVKG